MSLISSAENKDILIWNSSNTTELINNEYYDGLLFSDNDVIALENLLAGDAKGTKRNDYLDPNPFYNKKGISYLEARADEIKVGVENMDYTGYSSEETIEVLGENYYAFYDLNGDGIVGYDDSKFILDYSVIIEHPEYLVPFFVWKNEEEIVDIITKEYNGIFFEHPTRINYREYHNLNNCISINENGQIKYLVFTNGDAEDAQLYPIFKNRYTNKWDIPNNCTSDLLKIIEDENLLIDQVITALDENNADEIVLNISQIIINRRRRIKAEIDSSLSSMTLIAIEKYAERYDDAFISLENFIKYIYYENAVVSILNLLMPRYARRVEVEDLNKNFWVIAQTIEAILRTGWGPGGIIDIIQELIKRQNNLVISINDFIQKTESIGNPEAICLLHPRIIEYLDTENLHKFDLNGDGLWGIDDCKLLLYFYAVMQIIQPPYEKWTEEAVIYALKGMLEDGMKLRTFNKSVSDTTDYSQLDPKDNNIGNNNDLQEALYAYLDNGSIRKRTEEDFLVGSENGFCMLYYTSTEEGIKLCSGFYKDGYEEIDGRYDGEELCEQLGKILYQKLILLKEYISLDAPGAATMLKSISISPVSDTYKKQTRGLIDTFYKPQSFGFLYDDFYYPPQQISSNYTLEEFGTTLTKFFYVKNDTTYYYNEEDYKWERAVMTTIYHTDEEGNVSAKWGTIPHLFAYQPEGARYRLQAAFTNFETFVNFIAVKDETLRIQRKAMFKQLTSEYTSDYRPYILLIEESIKNQMPCILLKYGNSLDTFCQDLYDLIDNDLDIETYFNNNKKSFLRADFNNGKNYSFLTVSYWGQFQRQNYFEIMRILSRRVAFKITTDSDGMVSYIQNYCFPAYLRHSSSNTITAEKLENYYLRYDIRKIIPYYFWNKNDSPIVKVKNYFGPLLSSGVTRFRGVYFTPIWPYQINEDSSVIDNNKIYLNRVHTDRHTDAEWNQALEFYTVEYLHRVWNEETQQFDISFKSYDFGSPHCADLADNYLPTPAKNWESPNNYAMNKIEFYGHVPGITYTTETEKTWFITGTVDEEGNKPENIFTYDVLAWG